MRARTDPGVAAAPSAPALPIVVEVRGARVRKTYRADLMGRARAEAKFRRECAAYRRFAELGADFVPPLLAWDEAGLWLETGRVAGGRTLIDWLEAPPHNGLDPVITQLVRIDKFLYVNRIDYLGGSPKDVLVDEDYRVFIVDFEDTFLDERFEDSLYDRMFHARMRRVADARNRELFLVMLAGRRKDFHRLTRRKLASGLRGRLRLDRRSRLERRR